MINKQQMGEWGGGGGPKQQALSIKKVTIVFNNHWNAKKKNKRWKLKHRLNG